MTTLPAANFFNGEITNQEAKDAQDGILAVLRELPGGAAEETRVIASGAITPQRGVVAVDSEDQAPADDLDVINTTRHPPGRPLLLRAVDQGRPVTVRHAQGGPGEIHLTQGLALTLQQPRTWLRCSAAARSGTRCCALMAMMPPARAPSWTCGAGARPTLASPASLPPTSSPRTS
jgi:hypothetical protein